MKIGLLGLQGSGKTTIFNASTKAKARLAAHANGKAEPNVAVVKVLDERVDRLSELYLPRKTIYATVEFVDFAGLTHAPAEQGAFSNTAMGMIRNMDALALVVRNFEDALQRSPTPLQDIRQIEDELILMDLIAVESRLARIEKGHKGGQRPESLLKEEKALRRIQDSLSRSRPIREMVLSSEEEKGIRGFQLLTKKSLMVILNSDDDNFGKNSPLMAEIEKRHRAVEIAGKFEMELSQIDDEEAKLYMEDMHIRESAYRRLTTLAYEILGYISFFTVGSDEVRAWNIHRGDTALDAAAAIHSDLARGFIRAECFSYDDCLRYGSEKGVKEKGLFRLEGKDYLVQDGDILNIRFNV
jgi:GTP-binding protein YchF